MMEISFSGLLGAIVGTIVAALCYGTLIDAIERFLTARRSPAERSTAGAEVVLLRHGVLTIDILTFAGLGYWIGHVIGA